MSLKLPPLKAGHLHAALPPEQFAAEIMEIERELDQVVPDWQEPMFSRLGPQGRGIRGTASIAKDDVERRSRAKYLLQRRKYLYDGHDWAVVVLTAESKRGPPRMGAGPARRTRRHYTPDDVRELSRRKWPERLPLMAQVPAVCEALGLDIETVERALVDCPATSDPTAHVRGKLGLA